MWNILSILKEYNGILIIIVILTIYIILFVKDINLISIKDDNCNFNIKGENINKDSIYDICYTLGCDVEFEDENEDSIEHKCVQNVYRSAFSLFWFWFRSYWIHICLFTFLCIGITIQVVKYNASKNTPVIQDMKYFSYV